MGVETFVFPLPLPLFVGQMFILGTVCPAWLVFCAVFAPLAQRLYYDNRSSHILHRQSCFLLFGRLRVVVCAVHEGGREAVWGVRMLCSVLVRVRSRDLARGL